MSNKLKTIVIDSPNFSDRKGTTIDTIMLHSTSSSLVSALSWLTNPSSKVSSHYLISKDGTIYKLVPTKYAAWHAGKCKVENANSRSIGIEMEQLINDVWTDKQKDSLFRLISILKRAIPTIKYLVGHKEWNSKKIDPYNVDMDELRKRFLLEDLK